MIYLPRNQKGFISVHTFILLGVFLSLWFSFAFLSAVSQAKMMFRTKCYSESIALQKQIIAAEKKLFLLNPLSTYLSLLMKAEQLKLVTVGTTGPAAAPILAEIARIYSQQLKLEKAQKAILASTEFLISTTMLKTRLDFLKNLKDHSELWSYFLELGFSIKTPHDPRMSVEPISAETAPNYGLTTDYKTQQTVAYKWHFDISIKDVVRKVFKGIWNISEESKMDLETPDLIFEQACVAIPNKDGDKWTVEIEKVRY